MYRSRNTPVSSISEMRNLSRKRLAHLASAVQRGLKSQPSSSPITAFDNSRQADLALRSSSGSPPRFGLGLDSIAQKRKHLDSGDWISSPLSLKSKDNEMQKILIVDDQTINAEILSSFLEDSHHIIMARSGKQALQILENDPEIDLVLLDVIMPTMDGYETIRRIKANESTRNVPVIFITGLSSTEDEEKGLKLGASDYITKPFQPAIIRFRVENHLQSVRQRKMLENLAGLDGLTEIGNRRSFETTYSKEWIRALRNGLPLSVAMIDVDFFKGYNDFYGHAGGDDALKKVAAVLQHSLRRPGDIAARYGGEEFVVLLPEIGANEAKEYLDSIRNAIFDLAIPHEQSEAGEYLTVSIGGATKMAHETREELLRSADEMLYKAKSNGRNAVCWEY